MSWRTLWDGRVAARRRLKVFRATSLMTAQCGTCIMILIWFERRRRRCLSFYARENKTLEYFILVDLLCSQFYTWSWKEEESLSRMTSKRRYPQLAMLQTSSIFSWTLETAFLCLLSDRVYTLAMIMLWLPKYKDSLYCQLWNNKNGTKRGKFKLLQQLPVISIYWEGNRG